MIRMRSGWAAALGWFVVLLPSLASAQTVDTFNPGTDSLMFATAVQADAKIIIGGGFSSVKNTDGTVVPRAQIARLNADGSIDLAFNPNVAGGVYSLAIQADGKIIVGGQFGQVNGVQRFNLARLNADGTLDTSFIPNPTNNGSAIVSAIAVQEDGKIIVGGQFNVIAGTARANIARLNEAGTIDAGFDPGTNGAVNAIAIQADERIVVAGAFTTLGGGGTGTTTRVRVGRLESSGALDAVFEAAVSSSPVRALAIQADGKILVGGEFGQLSSTNGSFARPGIGRINADASGTIDTVFNPIVNGPVLGLAVQADGKILIGGVFGELGVNPSNVQRWMLARVFDDGTVDPDFNPGASGNVIGLAMQPGGKLVVLGPSGLGGGTGTTPRSYIGRLQLEPTFQTLTLSPNRATITWLRSGPAIELTRVRFSMSTDGVTFTDLGAATRISGGWELTGLNVPFGPNTRLRARGTYPSGYQTGSSSLYEIVMPVNDWNIIENFDFSAGMSGWLTFATPNSSYIVQQIDPIDGLFEFYRVPPPAGTQNQALIFQNSGMPVPAGTPFGAEFQLGNNDNVRKRISVLLHDADFTDLTVCTFWLPPNAAMTYYGIRTHTTKTWTDATISFYAATAGSNTGGGYRIDNVTMKYVPLYDQNQTECWDPRVAPSASGTGTNNLVNGDFSSGQFAPNWSLFGQIQGQVTNGVGQFIKLPGAPAGVLLQQSPIFFFANERIAATFRLGNSSNVRKRVTVLLHDSSFTDLVACTFWLAPGQPLSSYMIRGYSSVGWNDSAIAFYPATVGNEQWIEVDDVTLRWAHTVPTTGTNCYEPGFIPTGDALPSGPPGRAQGR